MLNSGRLSAAFTSPGAGRALAAAAAPAPAVADELWTYYRAAMDRAERHWAGRSHEATLSFDMGVTYGDGTRQFTVTSATAGTLTIVAACDADCSDMSARVAMVTQGRSVPTQTSARLPGAREWRFEAEAGVTYVVTYAPTRCNADYCYVVASAVR